MKAVLRNASYLCTVDLHFSNDGIKKIAERVKPTQAWVMP